MIKEVYESFKEGMEGFGENIAAVVNGAFLTIAYFLGVGVISIIFRIMNKRFLETKIEPDKNTYWEKIEVRKRREDYYRQF